MSLAPFEGAECWSILDERRFTGGFSRAPNPVHLGRRACKQNRSKQTPSVSIQVVVVVCKDET